MSRISGNNLAYAELCLHYGQEKFLDRAEKICYDCAAWDILQKLHRLKIKYTLRIDFEDLSEEINSHKYLSQKLIYAGELLDETITFCDKHSTNPNYSATNYLDISLLVDEAINGEIIFIADEEFAVELNLLYEKIFSLIDLAAKDLFLATEFTAEEKIDYLEKIRDFYDANDYTAMYRSENFSDPEKQYFYQTEIDKLKSQKNSEGIVIDGLGINLCDLAFDYRVKGEFDKAIALYEKAYSLGGEQYDYVLHELAMTCKEAGYTERAIENLKRILEIDYRNKDKPNFNYTCYACSDLINILFTEGHFQEAQKFAKELIHYNASANDSYEITWLIVGWYNLYRLETEPQSKKIFWANCLENFQLLDGEKNLSNSLRDFLKTYVKKLPNTKESLEVLDSLIKRTDKYNEENMNRTIFERAIEISNAPRYVDYHIKFLTEYSLYLSNLSASLCEEAMTYCNNAENFLAKNNIHDDYLQSLIYFAKSQCMFRADNFSYEQIKSVKEKCNYILLTEKKIEHLADAERYEAWKDAADFYNSFDEYSGRLHCLKKAIEFLDAKEAENVWRLNCEVIDCYTYLGEAEEVRRAVLSLYTDLAVTYSVETKLGFANKVKTLAGYLEKTNAVEEFFALNFFAIYAILADDVDRELISKLTLNEKFFNVFAATLDKNFTPEKLDFINDICEGIKSSSKRFYASEKYLALIEKFLYEYQFNKIEFKN